MELYLTEFHLSDFLQGITEICQIRAQQQGISLIYEPLTPLPTCVQADEKRLRQILINLLDNAVKYGPAGQSITVGLSTGHNQVLLRPAILAPEQPVRSDIRRNIRAEN
mgnify:CR=1 FL=1